MEKTRWQYVDVYPKVVPAGKRQTITICPTIDPGLFAGGPLEAEVLPVQQREYPLDDTPRGHVKYVVEAGADGRLRFQHAFQGEQEHFIRVRRGEKTLCQVSVYSILEDLAGLIPLYGDQHVHTNHSDGREGPGFVAAEFRARGYDYIAITDHHTMSGSLAAREAFWDAPTGFHIMTGEEVHLPDCPLHVVHIGGRWSVNCRTQDHMEMMDERDPGLRARFPFAWERGEDSDFPGTMSVEDFHKVVWDYAQKLDPIPEGLPRFALAGFAWICEEIRRAGGLPIFVHPYWIDDLYHADERLTEYILTHGVADAYEVLGGERYFEQNGFQAVQYYELTARGHRIPIVGSSDSHRNYDNPLSQVASTITFARANRTAEILEAIRARRTVAVDRVNPSDPRLVGDYRLVKYAQFLLANYFPLHESLCAEEGRAMKDYYSGDREEGERMLRAADGRIERLWKKCFAFDVDEGREEY